MASPKALSPVEARERARGIVLRHGWNTTCYQILNPGIDLWFSARHDAVVGFVRRGRVRVVAGAPVCPLEDLPDVWEEWQADSKRRRHRTCFFGAEQRIQELLASRTGFSAVVLGAQPVWSPQSFATSFEQDRNLRYQISRARNKGVQVHEWPSDRADDPRLWALLDNWLASRGLPTMHFMVEPHTLSHLMDRRLFVAQEGEVPVGFVVLSPVPERRGWLTEQFPRATHAPNGTVEATLLAAVEAVCDDGSSFVTMGIVPLSSHGHGFEANNPPWLRLAMKWARAHGRRFYNFEGLDEFKSKFRPDTWEPIYVISEEPQFSPGTLYAIAAAFSDGFVLSSLMRGLGRAIRQEASWLGARLHSGGAGKRKMR